jgi:hypothetical protein
MTSAVAAFGIAVGGTSLICYLLMTRLQNRRASRGSSGGSGADGGDYGGGDGWSFSHWFGGGHSALDPSGNPIDFGAMAAEAVMAVETGVAEAIDACGHRKNRGLLICRNSSFLDSF